MSVLAIAGLGVVLVLGLILVVRLHPLIALLLGSLFLLAATPTEILIRNQLQDQRLQVLAVTSNQLIGLNANLPSGNYLLWSRNVPLDQAPILLLNRATPDQLAVAIERAELSPPNLVWYAPDMENLRLTKGSELVPKQSLDSVQVMRWKTLGTRLVDGFTKTVRKLGIPVTMAAIIGVCLLESGAATRLVQLIMQIFGSRGTAPALTASGFVLGEPVFFDNVFYLLLPLAKAVGRVQPKRFLTAVMAIIVGATMAHSLVPPTPGPLFVADQIGVSVGMMMIAGTIVGSITVSCGFLYGMLCSRWVQLSPDGPGSSQESDTNQSSAVADGAQVPIDAGHAVPLWMAGLPILVPVVMLGGSEVVEFLASGREPTSRLARLNEIISIFNDPTLILSSRV